MEFLRAESISPIQESNPFLLSWLRSGRSITLLFLKEKGKRTLIFSLRNNSEFLRRSGWKFSDEVDFKERGRKIFVKGDSRLIKFWGGNYADKIVELLNEEEFGSLLLEMKPHFFKQSKVKKLDSADGALERKSREYKGWKLSIAYSNENLGNYLCHIFSSSTVTARKGKIGFSGAVIAWWEIHHFIPTSVVSLDRGGVKIGTTANRGDVFTDAERNPHTLISGASGAGKSSMIVGVMNHILNNKLGKVILIDPHGDTAKKMEESDFRKFIFSPDSMNSINVIRGGVETGMSYRVAEDFVSILRSSREIQFTDPLVGPRMEDLITRGISLLANIRGMTLVDLYNVFKERKTRDEISMTTEDPELKKFLYELDSLQREELASTERAIGRLVNDPVIRSMICNPEDDGLIKRAMDENDLVLFDLERSSLGHEDSKLLSNIFAMYIWFAISSTRGSTYFLFLEEGQDYQSSLMADLLSSGRKFGLRVTFVTTSFRAITANLESLLFSNVSNYVFMKSTEPDRLRVKELIGTEIELPSDPFDFLLLNPNGKEKGFVQPIRFPTISKDFRIRDFDYLTLKSREDLESEIVGLISDMKEYESTYFVFEEFCQVLKSYDRAKIIAKLKEVTSRDESIHFVGRITLNSGEFRGRHECFQVRGSAGKNPKLPKEFRITSDLISGVLEKK